MVIHGASGYADRLAGRPGREHICEETTDEVVLMKDVSGRVIGLELLHCPPADPQAGLAVEAVVPASA
jgi:hypothetical protein